MAREEANQKRELEGVGKYDKDGLTHIVSLMKNVSQALGLLHAVQQEITGLKGHQISPDGKLGGKGYVMTLRKFKDIISEAVNNLSDLDDTLSDELTNPRWELTEEELAALIHTKDEIMSQAEEAAGVVDQFKSELEQIESEHLDAAPEVDPAAEAETAEEPLPETIPEPLEEPAPAVDIPAFKPPFSKKPTLA